MDAEQICNLIILKQGELKAGFLTFNQYFLAYFPLTILPVDTQFCRIENDVSCDLTYSTDRAGCIKTE